MPKISVVVVTKDEQRKIAGCLQSVQWADEIVIVDSYSSDHTADICRQYTDRVFQRPWTDYADQKNYAISLATNPWVLLIDADERVTSELCEEILATIQGADNVVCFHIPTLEYMFGRWVRHGGWYAYHARLFLKDKVVYKYPVHERIVVRGKQGYLANPLVHYSHLTIADFIRKLNNYTTLEAEYLYKVGKRCSLLELIFFPLGLFTYKYVFQQGFRDGWHGLVIGVLYAVYHFVLRAKLGELWFRADPSYVSSGFDESDC